MLFRSSLEVQLTDILLAVVLLGAIAQLGERLLCKQEVTGSIPVGSTSLLLWKFKTKCPARGTFGLGFFVRLLFNNLEEVKI